MMEEYQPYTIGNVTYYHHFDQGSGQWYDARRGLLTASEIKLILTPAKLQYADNDKSRTHLYELLAQRISGHTEASYISDDMLRGMEDEIIAREKYKELYADVKEVGFITNDKWGFKLGYSPDGLVGADGLIEVKSRRQKYQIETIISGEAPIDYMLQLQTGLLVSERSWLDFITYCGGLPMFTTRVYPDEVVHKAITEAAYMFEKKLQEKLTTYYCQISDDNNRLIPTERRIEQEMTI